ncbi:MAG: RDD family protein [Pseudonocardia sp.]|nr:RDD family protein [Pseudonocardia sp.]
MAGWMESWMPGSPGAGPGATSWPGERFGLPADGVGSVAGFGRRLAALTVDWLSGYLIAALFTGPEVVSAPFTVLGIWFLLTAVPVAVFGASAGMTALGIRVASIGSAAVVGVPRALARTALVAMVVPPLVRDADGRGWHDRATRTMVVRTRA